MSGMGNVIPGRVNLAAFSGGLGVEDELEELELDELELDEEEFESGESST